MATRQREKSLKIQENKDKRPKAIGKYIRISPSKVRIVLDLIKNKDYNQAVAILDNVPNIANESIKKVLVSAGANAENNIGLSKKDLYVAEAFADGGPVLKRAVMVSKGRPHSIKKRTSHITIILDERRDA